MASVDTKSSRNPWKTECELLQCVDCPGRLEAGEEELSCVGCGRRYPIRDGVLQTMQLLEGNNKVAADYYNSPLWPKFRFWEYFAFFLNGGIRRSRRQVFRHLPDLSGKRLLEVAIGDGDNLPLVPADTAIYGIDISAVQLAECRRRFSDRQLRLILGEAEKLPFRDQTFDHVVSVGAFNYFSDPLASLREMARVVKSDGLVVVADELPNLPNVLLGYWIGLPQLDRWMLKRFAHLSDDFTAMVDRHRHLKLEPIVEQALQDWAIHRIWLRCAYCIVGRPKKTHAKPSPTSEPA
jgi:ubiquinone/menaquinone biosynthesis C-methylase UbiE